ncbi:COG4315 family predicted lipoprotein [Streptomyces sp. CA-249302]|uniref:COG4315 family predicted lipoprotein n=1 Tax=Streptomyces sp. CA-249302 TaxID=3240058 RepID=UPI003D8D39FF
MTSLFTRRAAVASVLALCGALSLSACGKTISIGDSSAPASSAPASPLASASPSSTASAQGAGNSALQVVDSTAQDNGLSGTGGTVVGAAVQETPPKWVQLSAVTSAPLNAPHLININQASLYRFDADTAGSGQSACNDACAVKWPPVTVQEGGNVYLAGVDPKQVGAFRRQDGQVQITVGGRPLYRFSGDTKPGDLNGQGLDGKWFAAGPKGEKVTQ